MIFNKLRNAENVYFLSLSSWFWATNEERKLGDFGLLFQSGSTLYALQCS